MTASRTMILIDPDLPSTSRSGAAQGASRKADTATRLPSVRALNRFLAEAQATVRLKGQVTVLLTTNPAIRRLNRQFRGKNKATDVLSFPAMQGPGAEEMAGDLAISVPTASKQAGEQGHPLATEIKVLILHGLLHLAGYDHETDEGQMARRERLLRAKLKLPLGLIERAGQGSLIPTLSAKGRRKDGAPKSQRGTKVGSAKKQGAPSSRTVLSSGRVGIEDARSTRTKTLTKNTKRSMHA